MPPESAWRSFEYQPLPEPSKQIRLLKAASPVKSRPKRDLRRYWTITVYDLDQVENTYRAISYTWGNPLRVESLYLNDQSTHVSQKLHDVIDMLRDLDQMYWIDALCINQADADEKSQQVQLMHKIYSGARVVTVYLDSLTDESKDATLPDDHYFERMWIVQEFLLAKNRIVIGPDHVFGALGPACYPKSLTMSKGNLSSLMNDIYEQTVGGGQWKPLPIVDLIRKYGGGKCSDPRDQIYSLISLACDPDGSAISFPVDYRKSRLEVFEEFVDYIHFWYPVGKRKPGANDVVVKIAGLMQFNHQEANDAMMIMDRLRGTSRRRRMRNRLRNATCFNR